MENRYIRNIGALTPGEQDLIGKKRVAVVGLGGLGGHLAELWARLGIGSLILIDPDSVEESNLNRQLFASSATLGLKKTEAAKLRLRDVNPSVELTAIPERLDSGNLESLLRGADLVMDGLDSIPSRLVLQDACRILGITLVHGAAAGWQGQVCVIRPGDDTLDRIYSPGRRADKAPVSNLAFAPAAIAALQVSLGLGVLLGMGADGNVLHLIDLRSPAIERVTL